MKIVIEVGTEEQKKIIADELEVIQIYVETSPDPINVCGIWVPKDFDGKVNELQGTSNYVSDRGQLAVAKTITTSEGIHLVFSGVLFTELYDTHTRMSTYFHELIHAINKNRFPVIPSTSPSNKIYYQ